MQIFTTFAAMKISPLVKIGAVPVTTQIIGSFFPEIAAKTKKVNELEKANEIIRLKKGLYVVHPQLTGKALSTELIANQLYAPSYVSMQSALRYYQLIPETVYEIHSMTIKSSRQFETPLGHFRYTKTDRATFAIGLRQIKQDGLTFVMATPEKALCDLIAHTPKLTSRYVKEAAQYLEEDLRIDMDAFRTMNRRIFEAYIQVGKKSNSIRTLLKLFER